jgi:hypothetical protein
MRFCLDAEVVRTRLASDPDHAAPHVIDVEVLNVFRLHHRAGRLERIAAQQAIDDLRAWPGEASASATAPCSVGSGSWATTFVAGTPSTSLSPRRSTRPCSRSTNAFDAPKGRAARSRCSTASVDGRSGGDHTPTPLSTEISLRYCTEISVEMGVAARGRCR